MSLEENAFKIQIAGGAELTVPADAGRLTPYVLLEQDDWFESEIRFVRQLAKKNPGLRAVDIGANYGCYALSLAAAGASRVWAIEPASSTAAWLSRSTDGAHAIEVLQMALSDQSGFALLAVERNPEMNRLSLAGETGSNHETVAVETIDRLAIEHGWSEIDLVKLDAEGHEVAILDGGDSLFRDQSPLILLERMHGKKENRALLDALAARGYTLLILLPGLMQLVPYQTDLTDDLALNVFAAKPDQVEKLTNIGMIGALDDLSNIEFGIPSGLGSLRAAERNLRQRIQDHDEPSTCMSLARVLLSQGRRVDASILLKNAIDRMLRGESMGAAPDLAPDADFDHAAASDRSPQWAMAAAITALERCSLHSSYFSKGERLPLLQWLAQSDFNLPEMDRRRQFMEIRAGICPGPKETPVLASASEDQHRNAWYWRS